MKPASNSRRYIAWSAFRTPFERFAAIFATAFGAGLSPWAPGTAGTLVALPLCAAVSAWGVNSQIFFWIMLTAAGTWASRIFVGRQNVGDHQSIVIDEVAGMGITLIGLPFTTPIFVTGFFLFRFFDIVKLPPVRMLDQWSKNQPNPWAAGWGVMGDDVLAGLQGLLVLHVLVLAGIL